ncbi:MAG: FG-GAP repeat protein [Phycisphaerales bacterium]|nr:FG-GAP repeat protein [Phycisphaerales bacterium]
MRYLMLLLAAAASAVSTAPAHADFGDQLFKLTADDAAAGDSFGRCVALGDNVVVVGADGDDDAGTDSGSAYVFDATTGLQLHKLTADDGAIGDEFGYFVAASSSIAVVGAPSDNDAGSDSGSAYVFDTNTGQQLHKLTANDGAEYDRFGWSVAVSGNIAVIGAFGDDDAGTNSGAAYVFDVTTGQQLRRLTANDASSYDAFGYSVALAGNIAIIGAPGADGVIGFTGAAYVFDVTTGQQLRKLFAGDGADADHFGESVGMSGDIAIIGAPWDDDAGEYTGSAYVFDITTGQQLYKLTADDLAEEDHFGCSVALSGSTAVVGAFYDDDAGVSSGSAYVFNATTGQQVREFTADDAAQADQFGVSVAISNDVVAVGAFGDDDAGGNSGSAYLFDAAPCPGDLDGDYDTDQSDLGLLLSAYGIDDGGDLDGDGDTDQSDLGILLGDYGCGT